MRFENILVFFLLSIVIKTIRLDAVVMFAFYYKQTWCIYKGKNSVCIRCARANKQTTSHVGRDKKTRVIILYSVCVCVPSPYPPLVRRTAFYAPINLSLRREVRNGSSRSRFLLTVRIRHRRHPWRLRRSSLWLYSTCPLTRTLWGRVVCGTKKETGPEGAERETIGE